MCRTRLPLVRRHRGHREVTTSSLRSWDERTRTRNEEIIKANFNGMKTPRKRTEPRLRCVAMSKPARSRGRQRGRAGSGQAEPRGIQSYSLESSRGLDNTGNSETCTQQTAFHTSGCCVGSRDRDHTPPFPGPPPPPPPLRRRHGCSRRTSRAAKMAENSPLPPYLLFRKVEKEQKLLSPFYSQSR